LIDYFDKLRRTTQLILVTHQRRTMEAADILYGVSMQAAGVSKLVSQRLDQALRRVGYTDSEIAAMSSADETKADGDAGAPGTVTAAATAPNELYLGA
jgi:hypothetical protein